MKRPQNSARDGIFRLFWKRLYRELRLQARAEAMQREYEIIHGTGDPTKVPTGILNCAGLQRDHVT